MDLSWMAWTWQTAAFFVFILAALTSMSIWEWLRPGGAPRRGILGLETTRGDRLFLTLVGAAFIHLGWLAFTDAPLWGGTIVSVAYAIAVFRWV